MIGDELSQIIGQRLLVYLLLHLTHGVNLSLVDEALRLRYIKIRAVVYGTAYPRDSDGRRLNSRSCLFPANVSCESFLNVVVVKWYYHHHIEKQCASQTEVNTVGKFGMIQAEAVISVDRSNGAIAQVGRAELRLQRRRRFPASIP